MTSIRSETASAVLRRLDDWGIRYCVLRGFDGSTEEPGRDVDLVVEPADLGRLAAAVAEEAGRQGWQFALRCQGHHEGESFYLLGVNRGSVEQLEIHATKVGWAGLPILDESELLNRRVKNERGVWVADGLHQVVQRLVQHVLSRRPIEGDAWHLLRARSATQISELGNLLTRTIGSERLAASTTAALAQDRPEAIHDDATAIRISFVGGRLRDDWRAALGSLARGAIRRLVSAIRPARCGVLAIVETPVIAREIADAVRSMFLEARSVDTEGHRSLKSVVDRAGLVLATSSEAAAFPRRIWSDVRAQAGPTLDDGIKAVVNRFVANHETLWSKPVLHAQQV